MIIRSGITYVLPPEETEGLPDETLRLFRETLAEIDTWLDMSITNGWIKADLS